MIKNVLLLFGILLFSSCHEKVIEYYENGDKKEVYTLRNKQFDGEYKAYYIGDVLRAVGHFKGGKMDGEWKYYYEDGSKQSIQEFKEGTLIALDFWDSTGRKTVTSGTGVAELYYQGGMIESSIAYKENKRNGYTRTWFESGQIETEIFYQNDSIVGEVKRWDSDGNRLEE